MEIVSTTTFEKKEKHGLGGRKDGLPAGEVVGQRMIFWRRGSVKGHEVQGQRFWNFS